jgi:hypothetical protein
VYGARLRDAMDFGFNELPISNEAMKRVSGSGIQVNGLMREDALELHWLWRERKGRAY